MMAISGKGLGKKFRGPRLFTEGAEKFDITDSITASSECNPDPM